jgi:hypothetical protein
MARSRKSKSAACIDKKRRRLQDPGPDEGGRFSPSPYALQHGHVVEVAPQELRITKDSSFPKRITTQRVIDRYRSQGHITLREWRAANYLWQLWCESGSNARLASAYDPVMVSSSPNLDGMIAKRVDAAAMFLDVIRCVPYRSTGCVRAVVIEDWSASQWARGRGYSRHDSEHHGLTRLRPGLSALADHLGY